MQVKSHPIKEPAVVLYREQTCILIVRTGLVPESFINVLDRLLRPLRIH